MAAVTSAAIGGLTSGIMAISGANQQKKAQSELNNYERQTLDNAFENIQISTAGSDLIREESQRTSADLVDASRNGGIRGVLGGIPKIQAGINDINKEARKNLDDQFQRRDYAIAGDKTRIRDIRENRDNANISALSSQVEAGRQDMWNGITGIAKAGATYANMSSLSGNPQIDAVSLPDARGIDPYSQPMPMPPTTIPNTSWSMPQQSNPIRF